MSQPDIRIFVDHAQKRLWQGRQSRITLGKDCLDSKFFSDVYADSISGTTFLRPQVYEDDWQTISTGRFGRLAKASFTFEDDSIWEEHNWRFNGDIYLHSLGSQSQVVKTALTYEKNRGFFVSFFQYNTGQEVSMVFECGWGDGPDASDLYLQFWTDGQVGVVVDGNTDAYAGGGTISGRDATGGQTPTSAMQPQRVWECLLIPCRKRELLVVANQGGGFRYIFEDETDDGDPEDQDVQDMVNPGRLWDSHVQYDEHVTYDSARRFWFRVNGQATVQVVPLKFPTSGYICGPEHQWTYVPNDDESPEFVLHADPPGYGTSSIEASLVDPDDPTVAYEPAPDGENKFRIKVAFTGSGIETHFFNACEASYKPIFATTTEPASGAFDITPYVTKLSLSVCDDESSVEADIQYREPETIEEHYPLFRSMGNRPIKIMLGDELLLDGWSECPKWSEAISDEARKGSIRVLDRWKAYAAALVVDPCPLDLKPAASGEASEARTIKEVFEFLFSFGNPNEDLLDFDIDPDLGLTYLPRSASPAQGEFSVQMDVGDSWASWLSRIKEDFCPLHMIGLRPGADERTIAFVKKRVERGDEPYYDLWPTIDEAAASFEAAGEDAAEALRLAAIKGTYRTSDQSTLEPEANVIFVTGMDKRDGKPIQSYIFNAASLDPATAPEERDSAWIGEERLFGWVDQVLSSRKALDAGAEILADRLFPSRTMIETENGFLTGTDLIALWRGDGIQLHGIGLCMIASFDCDFVKSPKPADAEAETAEDNWEWQDARYNTELIEAEEVPV